MAPVKRKRVSKKNKKSWRKHVDLKDLDEFLEDQRCEERLGLNFSTKQNEDLFLIDKTGGFQKNEPIIKPSVFIRNEISGNVNNDSMRLVETEVPKCHEALVKRSAVPPHIINKTRKKKNVDTSRLSRKILKRKMQSEMLRMKKKEALRTQQKKPDPPNKNTFSYDIWSKENKERDLNGCSEWLSEDTITHTLNNTGYLKKQVPANILKKPSLLPAIAAPHPGTSYNPSLKDHTNILKEVAETEIKTMNEENHLNRVTTEMFKKIPQAKAEKNWISEMTVGLVMSKDSDEDENEYKAVNPPVKNKKKTLQKRKKLKEALLLKEKLKREKIEKRKISDIYKLRKLNASIDRKEEKMRRNKEKRKIIKENKQYLTKLLSQVKYKEPEIDFHLAEELSGNLRNVKPEGNLLLDRFKSLQKRNILQPTLKRHVKKRKVKKYERLHTKMPWELQEQNLKKKKSKNHK